MAASVVSRDELESGRGYGHEQVTLAGVLHGLLGEFDSPNRSDLSAILPTEAVSNPDHRCSFPGKASSALPNFVQLFLSSVKPRFRDAPSSIPVPSAPTCHVGRKKLDARSNLNTFSNHWLIFPNLNISPPVAIPRSRSASLTSGGVSSTYCQYLYHNYVEWRGQCLLREPDCLLRWRGFATSPLFTLHLDDREFAQSPGPPTRV